MPSINPSPASARVEEFLRQWNLPSVQRIRSDDVYGVQVDRDLDYMAKIYATDLRDILDELAELRTELSALPTNFDLRADKAVEVRDDLIANSNGSIRTRELISHHDGRAYGLREARDWVEAVAGLVS